MPTETKPEPLSDVPSVAILQALEDLEACERDPRYEIHMNAWHEEEDGQCLVCLAGSVMAQRLGASVGEYLEPGDFERESNKLRALDNFRCGLVAEGLRQFHRQPVAIEWERSISYHTDPAAFKADMRRLAVLLAEHGL